MKNQYRIEKMCCCHIDEVAAAERMCFPDPWTRAMFEEEIGCETAHYFVCLYDDQIIGYCGYRSVIDEGDITNVAVLPEYRRTGAASALMEHMLAEAEKQKIRLLSLEVRFSNAAAIALYEKYGFKRVGVRPRYYASNGENAVIMQKEW